MIDVASNVEEGKAGGDFEPVDYVFMVLCSVMLLIGTLGNAAVFVISVCNRSMRTMMNVFLTNLAIGNFFFLLFCLPFNAMEDLHQHWYGGALMCKFVKFLQNASVLGSIMWLTALSVERRLAIRTSITRLAIHNPNHAGKLRLVCVIIWLLAVLLSVPMPVISEIRENQEDYGPRCGYSADYERFASIYEYVFLFGLMICLPIVVICVMHVKVAAILFKRFHIVTSESRRSMMTRRNTEITSPQIAADAQAEICIKEEEEESRSMIGQVAHAVSQELRTVPKSASAGLVSQLDSTSQMPAPGYSRTVVAWKRTANVLIVLVFIFALSYLPLCIVTFVYSFLENMNVPGYPATWCADGHSNDTHPNYTSTGNVSCRLIELPISASWVWKPSFLFARLIFYICPTLNPFIFYIISRQMRRIVRRYIQNIVSFFSLRNEKIRSSGQLLSKMNFVTVQPQFLELQPLSSSSRSAGVDGHAKVRVTMSTRQVIGLAPGLNQRYNLVACERRFRQEILQPTAQSGFSVYRHEYATYAI